MLLAIAGFVLSRSTAPSTFEEVQKGMYETYRKLTHYSDEWNFELQRNEQALHQSFSRKIDGPKSGFTAKVEGQVVFHQVHDGAVYGLAVPGKQQYAKVSGPNEDFGAAFEKAVHPKLEENSFNYYVQAYDVLFVSNPPFEVKSEEVVDYEGHKARKISADVARKDGSAVLHLRYWFDTDRWILRHVELDGKSASAGTFTIRGNLTKIDFESKISPSEFGLTAAELKDYKEVPLAELQKG
jgi:hypothetical protein